MGGTQSQPQPTIDKLQLSNDIIQDLNNKYQLNRLSEFQTKNDIETSINKLKSDLQTLIDANKESIKSLSAATSQDKLSQLLLDNSAQIARLNNQVRESLNDVNQARQNMAASIAEITNLDVNKIDKTIRDVTNVLNYLGVQNINEYTSGHSLRTLIKKLEDNDTMLSSVNTKLEETVTEINTKLENTLKETENKIKEQIGSLQGVQNFKVSDNRLIYTKPDNEQVEFALTSASRSGSDAKRVDTLLNIGTKTDLGTLNRAGIVLHRTNDALFGRGQNRFFIGLEPNAKDNTSQFVIRQEVADGGDILSDQPTKSLRVGINNQGTMISSQDNTCFIFGADGQLHIQDNCNERNPTKRTLIGKNNIDLDNTSIRNINNTLHLLPVKENPDVGVQVRTSETNINTPNTNVRGILNVTGNTNLTNTTVTGTNTITGNQTVSGTLGVTGNTNLRNTTVTGTNTITGNQVVSGTNTVNGNSSLKNTNVDGTFNVTGNTSLRNTTINGTFGVTGNTNLTNTTVTGTNTITGNQNVSGTLGVTGNTTLNNVNITGSLTGETKLSGSEITSHFNHGAAQHTYIRPGKVNSNVYINDTTNGGDILLSRAGKNTQVLGTLGVSGNTTLNNVNITGTADIKNLKLGDKLNLKDIESEMMKIYSNNDTDVKMHIGVKKDGSIRNGNQYRFQVGRENRFTIDNVNANDGPIQEIMAYEPNNRNIQFGGNQGLSYSITNKNLQVGKTNIGDNQVEFDNTAIRNVKANNIDTIQILPVKSNAASGITVNAGVTNINTAQTNLQNTNLRNTTVTGNVIINNGGLRVNGQSDLQNTNITGTTNLRNTNITGETKLQGSQITSYFNHGTHEHTYIRPGKANGNVILNDTSNGGDTEIGRIGKKNTLSGVTELVGGRPLVNVGSATARMTDPANGFGGFVIDHHSTYSNAAFKNASDNPFRIRTENADRFVVDKNGNIVINTVSKSETPQTPDGNLRITSQGIMFGGPNAAGKDVNSAQISAGSHVANSLNIMGMSSNNQSSTRKVDMWAEGGLTLHGGNLILQDNNSGIQITNKDGVGSNSNVKIKSWYGVGFESTEPNSKGIHTSIDTRTGTLNTKRILINEKWLLNDAHNNDWLYVYNRANTGYYGGVAAGKFWAANRITSAGDFCIGSTCINEDDLKFIRLLKYGRRLGQVRPDHVNVHKDFGPWDYDVIAIPRYDANWAWIQIFNSGTLDVRHDNWEMVNMSNTGLGRGVYLIPKGGRLRFAHGGGGGWWGAVELYH
jgi:hypothetical protein